jgi:hypothetical protein
VTFSANKAVETTRPTVVVDSGLPVGRHVFRLVVVNRDGRSSQPAEVVVTIEPTGSVIPRGITPTGPIGNGPSPLFQP